MGKYYELTKDFVGVETGTEFEAEKESTKFVFNRTHGRLVAIPREFVKEIKPPSSKIVMEEPEVEAGMSTDEAEELAKVLGGAKGKGLKAGAKAKAKPEPEEAKPEPVKLKKGEFLLSTVTGGKLPKSGIDHVMKEVDPKVFTKDQKLDIPEVDKMYVWNPDVLETMWMSYILNKKMLLSGYPGTGKTTAVAQFCAWIKQPMMRFNGKDGIEASSFLGYPWASKSGMEWKDGMLPQGVRQGYVVTIDECFKIPAGIQMAMQNLYEEGGYLTLDDKPGTVEDKTVSPAPTFRMYLTDNVKGTGDSFDKFSATQVQDSSTLDRFGFTAHIDYMTKIDEVNMLKTKYPKMPKRDITRLVSFANLIRQGYAKSELSLTLSPRGLQTICEVLFHVPDVQRAIQMVYMDKLGENDEIDAVKEMIRTVYR